MKKSIRLSVIWILSLVLALCLCALVACNADSGQTSGETGYTVTFVTNGGTTYKNVTTDNKAQKVVLPVPERSGSTFDGWYLSTDFSGEKLSGEYLPASDVTLYAKWLANSFTVKFETNGGTEYEDVLSDGTRIALPTPSTDGGVFAGWYLSADFSGEKLGEYFAPTASVTLYAKFDYSDRVTITLETNGGLKMSPLYDLGDGVTLPDAFKYNYAFDGWYLSADFSGEKLGETFTAEADVTLYAKYHEIKYLYIYYGDYGETDLYDRFEFEPDSIIELNDYLKNVVNYNGYELPVTGVTYDVIMKKTEDVPETLAMTENIYLVASLDTAALPKKNAYTVSDDGSVLVTGKSLYVYDDDGQRHGSYSMKARMRKGVEGDALLAFRIVKSNTDNAYENAGDYYLAAGVKSESGYLEAYSVIDGVWKRLDIVVLSGAPKTWQDKYNAASENEYVTLNITVNDHGNGFSLFIDGDYAYTVDISDITDDLVGTGYGMRSNSDRSIYSDWKVGELKTITFDTDGGSPIEPVMFSSGNLESVAYTIKEGYVFDGWYSDQSRTQKIDATAFSVAEDVVLYAKWVAAKYNVTLYMEGEVFARLGYNDGAIRLPNIGVGYNQANKFYTGWYYDEDFKNAVDQDNPVIDSDIDLFAGWRLPSNNNLTFDEEIGKYSKTQGTSSAYVALFGVTESEYNEYVLDLDFTKGATGGSKFAGLLFRMKKYYDGTSTTGGLQYISLEVRTGTNSDPNSAGDNGGIRLRSANVATGETVSSISSQIALSRLPAAWQEKYNAAAQGNKVSLVLKVRDYGTYLLIYIDDDLAMTYDNAEVLAGYNGNGYGALVQGATAYFNASAAALPVYTVTFMAGENEYSTGSYVKGARTLELPAIDPVKEGNYFGGWYYDEDCSESVNPSAPIITGDTDLYAKWANERYVVTLYNGDAVYDTLYYVFGAIDLPLPANEANRIFTGWYYDDQFENIVDEDNPVINSDIALFAAWRLPENSGFTYNEETDRYSATQGTNAALFGLFGTSDSAYVEYNYDLTYVIGATGGSKFAGLALRMKKFYDGQSSDEGLQYIGILLKTGSGDANGALRVFAANRASTGETVTTVNYNPSFSNLPAAWQEKYNAAAQGDTMNVLLTIRDYGTYLEVYIDGDLALTYDNALVAEYTGNGYGTYIQGSTVTFGISATEIPAYKVTLLNGEEVFDTVEYVPLKGSLTLPVPESAGTNIFNGWYYDEDCTDKVDENAPEINGDIELYAGWSAASYTVTLMKDGEVYDTVGYSSGTINLPAPENGWNKIFAGWYYEDTCETPVDASSPDITEDTVLYAGWRLPTNSALTYNSEDGTYTFSNVNGDVIIGESPYEKTEYKVEITNITTSGGAGHWIGFSFRMAQKADDAARGTSGNIAAKAVGVRLDGAQYRVMSWLPSTNFAVATYDKSNTTLSWGSPVNHDNKLVLVVRDYGDHYDVYIDGVFKFSGSKAEEEIDGVKYRGYGIHTNSSLNAGAKFKFTVSEITDTTENPEYTVTLKNGDTTIGTAIYQSGASGITLPHTLVTPGSVFLGWYYDSACMQKVDENNFDITKTTLFAGWEEIKE